MQPAAVRHRHSCSRSPSPPGSGSSTASRRRPLFVSDLQAVLDLPQPTVSRHLQVLRRAELVRDTPMAQFVLYRLRRDIGAHGRLLSAILDAVVQDDADMRTERDRAAERSRSHTRTRVAGPVADKAPRIKRPT